MEFNVMNKLRTIIYLLLLSAAAVQCVNIGNRDIVESKNYRESLGIATTTQAPVVDKDDEPTR